MKYLLGLILLVSVSASAQYSPTAAKTRFVNGIGLGTKDTLTMNAADTAAMIVGRDSLVYFRYKGYWKPLAYNSSLTGYVPYTGATSAIDLNAKTVVNISHLGINTTTVPTILLRAIGDNNSSSRIAIRGYSSDANSSSMRVTKFRGTFAAPQAPQNGDNLGKFELAGYGTTSSEGYPQATFEGLATENWGATARGAKVQFKITPNTTTTQAIALTINQDKTAKFESRVNVNGATDDGSTALNVTGTGKFSTQIIAPQYQFTSGISFASQSSGISYLYTNSTSLNITDNTGANTLFSIDNSSGSGIFKGSVTANGLASKADGFYLTNTALTANAAQIQAWYNSAGTRRAYFGYGSSGDNTFSLINETGGSLYFGGSPTFSSLAGTGSRVVVADASGTLSATTAAATSGTYTPTITLVTNAASSTARVCQYMRVGSVVTVSGYVTVTATTPAAGSRIYMSLPISSSFTSTAQAGGAGGVPGGANIGTVIFANSTATTVSMDFLPVSGATDYWFSYTYQIL
jgi:hypothetical protein